jgi:hypothetical protein
MAGLVFPIPEEPRCEYYRFAHWTLRELIFRDPDHYLPLLDSADARPELQRIWTSVTEKCKSDGKSSGLSFPELEITILHRSNRIFRIIRMPEAVRATEAHMIGIVNPARNLIFRRLFNRKVRYFTLEIGANTAGDGVERNHVGEWLRNGRHLRYGSMHDNSPERFVEFIEDLIFSWSK